jgi:hypothetical protein
MKKSIKNNILRKSKVNPIIYKNIKEKDIREKAKEYKSLLDKYKQALKEIETKQIELQILFTLNDSSEEHILRIMYEEGFEIDDFTMFLRLKKMYIIDKISKIKNNNKTNT